MQAIKRILVPVDFSPMSRAALDHALRLGQALGATVEVLHVHESAYTGFDTLVILPLDLPSQRWEQQRGQILRELGSFLGPDRDRVLAVKVEPGVPADVIPEVAREGEVDLIVMGTHGRGGLSRLVVGSVAEAVMRKAHCPVMTLKLPVRTVAREAVPL